MDSFIGEVRILPYTYAPEYWAWCDGQTLPITQNAALYAVIGTLYGGDGRNTFAVPNLAGSAPIGNTTGSTQPRSATGLQSVTLAANDLPSHNHNWVEQSPAAPTDIVATANGNSLSHGEILNGGSSGSNLSFSTFAVPPTPAQIALFPADMLSMAGSGVAHDNMQPYLVMNFCISLAGDFPIRP